VPLRAINTLYTHLSYKKRRSYPALVIFSYVLYNAAMVARKEINAMTFSSFLKTRRSVRRFKRKSVSAAFIEKVLEAGRWAPSGLNNQPWRFIVLEKAAKDLLAAYTHYGRIVAGADKAILVFLDKKASYHYEKDLMAIGAAIENMLLAVYACGLGACWLGEIINQRAKIQAVLKIPSQYELEAVIALGYPAAPPKKGRRKPLKKLLLR